MKANILVVDDTHETLSLLTKMLKEEGYAVFAADSGELALSSLEKIVPDLILLDIRMPGLNGFEVCRRIKSKDTLNKIPVIFLTAAVEVKDRLQAFKEGAVDYFIKPFEREELLARVKNHLELFYFQSQQQKTIEIAKEKELRLKMALEVSKAGVWEWNILKNNTYWSDEFLEVFGMPKETVAGLEAWTKMLHPDDIELATTKVQEAIDNRTELINEYRIVLSDGKIRWIRSTGHTEYDCNNPVRMLGLCWDITAQKMAEQELKEAKNKAEESDRLKSAFLANMSHEIRTPMNGILGFSELLKEPGLSGEKQLEYIRIIENGGQRLLNIISEIIDISKIESGINEIQLQKTNINKIVQEVVNLLKQNAEKKGLSLLFNRVYTNDNITIYTDRVKLYSVLMNLVKNAIKYTDKGSIEIGYFKINNKLEFYVKDTGIGIPSDKLNAIFERFIQADINDVQARQGAGLGLAIAKAYIELLGGKIWVESVLNTGSTFYFNIPVDNFENEGIVSDNIENVNLQDAPAKKLKILIAEDDEYSGMYLTIAINHLVKEIIKAGNGKDAVEICRNNHDIDLILMDIQMPELDGYDATRQIREFNKDVIIIAQTAFGLSGDREKSIAAGCNDYISKPINKDLLISMIEKYYKK